tara:strand:+ start:401 stop:700 length:300 start_codon:yes stop_codon:yes gene_type:complete
MNSDLYIIGPASLKELAAALGKENPEWQASFRLDEARRILKEIEDKGAYHYASGLDYGQLDFAIASSINSGFTVEVRTVYAPEGDKDWRYAYDAIGVKG